MSWPRSMQSGEGKDYFGRGDLQLNIIGKNHLYNIPNLYFSQYFQDQNKIFKKKKKKIYITAASITFDI